MNALHLTYSIVGLPVAAFTFAGLCIRSARKSASLIRDTDPVFAAIRRAQEAEEAFTAALVGLDENDPVAMRRADEAGDRSSDAINALAKVQPTTPAGFHALIRHYAADSALNDPNSLGALALDHLASVITSHPPP